MPKGDKRGKNSFTVPALNQSALSSPILKRLVSLILKPRLEVQMGQILYMKGSAKDWIAARIDPECLLKIQED